MIRVSAWLPPVVFAALTFAHALALPMFEGMDEPAHLSSILQFASGHGRPVPGKARLHESVERAVALVPGPYHQWENARTRFGGASYAEWRRLPESERRQRARLLESLDVSAWADGETENWQAQHPPLYYAIVGSVVRLAGVTTLTSAHLTARLASAAMFASLGLLLTIFITRRWKASPRAALFVCLLPMWYVMGARISNDALAMPALGAAFLLAADQIVRPAREWHAAAWCAAGAAAAVGLAAKAYGLAFVPVAGIACLIGMRQALRHHAAWGRALLPVAALLIVAAANGWWIAENAARGAGLTGQNENATLTAMGIESLADRLPFASSLVFDEPGQAVSAIGRGATQAIYTSNWTIGAAPWWFYALELGVLGAAAAPLARRPGSWPVPLRAAAIVTAAALLAFAAGIAKSVLDYYIVFGETRLAQGFYVWGAGGAFAAVLALAFDTLPPGRQRGLIVLQAACFAVAVSTAAMFWSGLYERDPVWRTPVRVTRSIPGELD